MLLLVVVKSSPVVALSGCDVRHVTQEVAPAGRVA
jgi:hypothetical protein